jgi:hypothetical protein
LHSGWALTYQLRDYVAGRQGHTVGVEDDSDDPQEDRHAGKTSDKSPSSTKSLNTEENENGSGDDFDDTVDTRGEETGVGALDTDGIENVLECEFADFLEFR